MSPVSAAMRGSPQHLVGRSVGHSGSDRRSGVEERGGLERDEGPLWATYLLCDLGQASRPL